MHHAMDTCPVGTHDHIVVLSILLFVMKWGLLLDEGTGPTATGHSPSTVVRHRWLTLAHSHTGSPIYLRGENYRIHWTAGWISPRTVPDAVQRRNISWPYQESNTDPSVVQPIACPLHTYCLSCTSPTDCCCMIWKSCFSFEECRLLGRGAV
jgi:hypothetical protein